MKADVISKLGNSSNFCLTFIVKTDNTFKPKEKKKFLTLKPYFKTNICNLSEFCC